MPQEEICRGYVQALYEGAPLTERQREIAIHCAILAAALTRTGRDALVDEATGYQYERAEDALQPKLRASIADELRAWEKISLTNFGKSSGGSLIGLSPCRRARSGGESW